MSNTNRVSKEYLRALTIAMYKDLPSDLVELIWQRYQDSLTDSGIKMDDNTRPNVYDTSDSDNDSDSETSNDSDCENYNLNSLEDLFNGLCKWGGRKCLEQLQFLLNKGMNINYQNPKTGFTALMTAVNDEDTKIVRFLLEHGADPHLANKKGKTVYDYVDNNCCNRELAKILTSHQYMAENRELRSQCQDLQSKYDHVSQQLNQMQKMMQNLNFDINTITSTNRDLPRKQARKT